MTYNVFSGTLNPTHFTPWPLYNSRLFQVNGQPAIKTKVETASKKFNKVCSYV